MPSLHSPWPDFQGPIMKASELNNEPGIYLVAKKDCCIRGGFKLLDAGESDDVQRDFFKHTRRPLWKKHVVLYAIFVKYTGDISPGERQSQLRAIVCEKPLLLDNDR